MNFGGQMLDLLRDGYKDTQLKSILQEGIEGEEEIYSVLFEALRSSLPKDEQGRPATSISSPQGVWLRGIMRGVVNIPKVTKANLV